MKRFPPLTPQQELDLLDFHAPRQPTDFWFLALCLLGCFAFWLVVAWSLLAYLF